MNIVITGASSGIGEALALHYAASGACLGLTGRSQERLEKVAEACRVKGAMVDAVVIDVTEKEGMAEWLCRFDDAHPIDLLIANAGIGGGGGQEATVESLESAYRMFGVNIYGVCHSIDPVIPRMAARGAGQLALMASLAGYRGLAGAPAYGASKGFVKLYGEGLRGALAPAGIKVSVICPGFVVSRITDMNDFYMPFLMAAPRAARIIAEGLKKNRARIAFPAPMAFAVWFFSALPAVLSERLSAVLPRKKG